LTYSVVSVSGATSYTWTLPSGWTGATTGNSITVTAGANAASGNITVTANNSCGSSSASSLPVTVNSVPAQPSAIVGRNIVNAGTTGLTYSVTNVSGVTYNWTLPSGWTGTTTGNSITVTAGTSAVSGNIIVTPSNTCGNGTAQRMNVVIPSTLPAGAGNGSLSGKFCFDIAQSNDTVKGAGGLHDTGGWRAKYRADFNEDTTRIQTYTFTPNTRASNVRFSYSESQPGIIVDSLVYDPAYATTVNIDYTCTAKLYYKTTLNASALHLTQANPLTVDIYVIFTNNNGTDQAIKMTVTIKDGGCCGAKTGLSISQQVSVYQIFMCHNLGADENADPFNAGQALHGAKYKWGMGTEAVNAADDATTSITGWDIKGGGIPPLTMDNWNMTTANPCPEGWRVPTNAELQNISQPNNNSWTPIGNFTANNWTSGFQVGDALFLPAAGQRNPSSNNSGTANIRQRGQTLYYWSSDTNNTDTGFGSAADNSTLTFRSNATFLKAAGNSVRCIAK